MELCCAAPQETFTLQPEMAQTQAVVESPIRVLLVEDNPEAAEMVQFSLDEDGGRFCVQWCRNMHHALTRLGEHDTDVVLLDLGLPELSGYRSFRAIQVASARDLPIVIFTADESILSKELTLGFGASDYLVKQNCSPTRLREALRTAVLQGQPPFDETSHGSRQDL
jgi:DNA-binding response OmpR family regulator